jgi:hydrogenase nickel incorporation protein HypA/HybF
MHEASIACGIIEIADDHCRKAGYGRIDAIEVNIGSASGILPDALQMAFEIARADTLASNASLIINLIPLGGVCRDCGREFNTDEAFILQCPNCGGKDFILNRGREMDIAEIEVN